MLLLLNFLLLLVTEFEGDGEGGVYFFSRIMLQIWCDTRWTEINHLENEDNGCYPYKNGGLFRAQQNRHCSPGY
jgi:hypothetical protein